MLLNIRSRTTNYHAAINSLVLWDQGVPKRLVEAFNHIGFSSSYSYQVDAVSSLSTDTRRLACVAANDPNNMGSLPYDNFNWRRVAWEVSALHGSIQHDQVSAMFTVPSIPERLANRSAQHLSSTARFDELIGARLKKSPAESLQDIVPSQEDYLIFRKHAIHHAAVLLSRDLPGCEHFASEITRLTDPHAITPHRTQRYYLPTFDQEQSSTRGNMSVLDHYFLDVLNIPKDTFESRKYFVLGDRLTMARVRAAQDQRSVDKSTSRFDHFSCFELLGGLMHYCLNMIQNFGRVHWGQTGATDALSLQTLRAQLPNRTNINTRKYDFYAWLRFLNVVLRSLLVSAALAELGCDTKDVAGKARDWSFEQFEELCRHVVDNSLLPSEDRLEADGVKRIEGPSQSMHAVLLAHDLMTLHEMRDAIKHGHPQRVLRILKFWAPMFYAGGGYNYSHETMELLHNLIHDWPSDSAEVLLASMLVNTTGKPDGFKEGDLDVEHLNNAIKARAHGVNATPKLLEKITPAIGEVQYLVRQLFDDLEVEDIYQRHSHVKQDEDVKRLVTYMQEKQIFRWDNDIASSFRVPDLLREGLVRLAGPNGGHMKHLIRHKLRLRNRHITPDINTRLSVAELSLARQAEEELRGATDEGANCIDYTIAEDELGSVTVNDLD